MGRIAQVKSFTRVNGEDGHGADVKADTGDGDLVTVPHFADPGDDSQPLPGDYVALEDSDGSGAEQATGYADTKNAGEAGPGEKRTYSRSGAGAVMAWIWLKADGSVVVENASGGVIEMAAGGDVTINGVVIDTDGNITVPGNIEADGDIDSAGNIAAEGNVSGAEISNQTISLGTHVHTSAAPGSPTGPGVSPPPPPPP
jgi:hypothetical protein